MRTWLSLLFLLTLSGSVFSQQKYAGLFSTLPVVSGNEKTIARNNITTIKEGLVHQGFLERSMIVDTATSTRKSFLGGLDKILNQVQKGDFVFLYFDIPFGIGTGSEKELKLVLDPGKPEQFILSSELQHLLDNISRKVGDPSMFFLAFDSDLPEQEELVKVKKFGPSPGIYLNYLFSCSPGQKRQVYAGTSLFASALTTALSSISGYNDSYRGFFNNVKKNVLLYTTRQTPMLVGNAQDMVLFNGRYMRYVTHFKITEEIDSNTVLINAGERLNILPGAMVKFYRSYSNPIPGMELTEGEIIDASPYSATVRLSKPLPVVASKAWVFVGENRNSNGVFQVKLNTHFDGDGRLTKSFQDILDRLKESSYSKYVKFVGKSGDLKINSIRESGGSLALTLVDPVSGSVLTEIKVDKDDISDLGDYIRRLSKYENLSQFTNFIGDIQVETVLTYEDSTRQVRLDNGYPVIYDEEEIVLTMKNPNPKRVYFSVVDLQPDKVVNTIFPSDAVELPSHLCYIEPNGIFTTKGKLSFSMSPPFGSERLKIITSLEPFDPQSLIGETVTRGTSATTQFENLNIQNYDFEIRNRLFSEAERKSKTPMVTSEISPTAMAGYKRIRLKNSSSGRVYFNLLKAQDNGTYSTIFPNVRFPEANCYVNSVDTAKFLFTDSLKSMDQLITVYADRPFNLDNYIKEERQLNDMLVEIIKNGNISGSPLNKILLTQQVYSDQLEIVSREGERIAIRLVTPKITTDRGFATKVKTQQYDINGFAMGMENKPVKTLKINGEVIPYDVTLRFFEKTVSLAAGKNRVVIEAEDEKGFKESKILEFDLESNEVTSSAKGKNYFLGIGIDQYKTWPRLKNAKNDVEGFASLMEKKFGFEKENMSFLLDDNATREKIINTIRDFRVKAGPNDNVIIYLSGHGNENQLDDGDYFFIPQDAEGDNEATFVTSWDIVGKFKKMEGRHCILIVDACYSGMITNSAGTGDRTIKATSSPASLENMPSKWIITSGRGTKVADGTGGNSPFATVLLNYLREKNKPEDLKITRLISFLVENVPKLNELQVPLGVQIQGEGEPVFKVSNPSMK